VVGQFFSIAGRIVVDMSLSISGGKNEKGKNCPGILFNFLRE
jgi:hypothetical protein